MTGIRQVTSAARQGGAGFMAGYEDARANRLEIERKFLLDKNTVASLQTALNRANAEIARLKRDCDRALARAKRAEAKVRRLPTIKRIVMDIEAEVGAPSDEWMNKSRSRDHWRVCARRRLIERMSDELGWTTTRIGEFMGLDHSTVVHHLNCARSMIGVRDLRALREKRLEGKTQPRGAISKEERLFRKRLRNRARRALEREAGQGAQ